jgi:hypothetical protein
MSNLVLNPQLSIRSFENNGAVVNIQTAAPKMNSSIKIKSFLKTKLKDDFKSLVEILQGEKVQISSELEEHLKSNNILIKEEEVSSFPKYICSPSSPLDKSETSDTVLNPNIQFSRPKEIEAMNENYYEGFDSASNIWVQDSFTNVWWPYAIKEELVEAISENKIKSLNHNEKALLSEIGILLPKSYEQMNKAKLKQLQNEYQNNNSVHITKLINSHTRTALARYYKELEKQGFLRLGDFQSYNRYWAHNDNMNRFLQAQLYPIISKIVQEEWRPAFSYYVAYKSGSSLKKHIDRSQASLSLSLLIEYGNEQGEAHDDWAFYVEKEKGNDEYYEYIIGKGNAGLFLGNDYVHYRLPLKKDHYSMSMLMHFVPLEFEGKML